MSEEPELMKLLLQVIREFLADCEHDIEGCSANELREIDGACAAAQTIRRRFVNLATGVPCDERGEAHVEREPLTDITGCDV